FEGDRLSCESFMANQFRLVLHTAAYNLMLLFREHTDIPEIQEAQIQTLRIKLIKVGGRVRQTVRRIWIDLSSTWPFQNLFRSVHATLVHARGG
ncbi:transposase, partial [candidate division KSB1 bacterium]|nr:transposase [candidate division KSB1 bacterium]